MKTKFLFGAMTALMVTACSQDEVVGVRQQEGIAYSVSANTQTRAADSYCNSDLPASFKVWAKSADGLYIDGDEIVDNDGVWSDADGTRYWPEGKTLDFYAEVNGDEVFSFNDGAPSFDNFTVEDGVADQVDLMYSVRKGQTKSVDKVQLNFRHALSQVCFWAKNNMKNMSVEIKGVSVGHLTNKGTFTFPTTDTDENYEYHSDVPDTQTLNGGTWKIPGDAQYNKRYDVTPLKEEVSLNPGAVSNLTCPGDDHTNGFTQVLTLLPQTVQAWDPTKPGTNKEDWNGAYFLLDVVLSNITEDNNTVVYDGKAAVPVSVNWEQGYRYIYTFVFDDGGNGGWTPDPSNPQPVLTTIKYDVTVDDFIPVNGDGNGTNMDTGTDETYKYSTTLNLHSNYGETEDVKKVQLNSNTNPYSFTLASEYTPSREDAEFLGWATTKDAISAYYKEGTSVSVDMENKSGFDLYAVWGYEFSITYDLNGGVGVNNSYESEWSGKRINGFVYTLGGGKATKDGYEFIGWGLTQDATEAVASITLDKNNPDVTVYAVWKKKQITVELSFDGNHQYAEKIINMPVTITDTVDEGDEAIFTIPKNTPELDGWIFKGWAETPNGNVVYNTDEELKLSESKTLYAVWESKTSSGDYPGTDY